MAMQTLFLAIVFLAAGVASYLVLRQFVPTPVEQRLRSISTSQTAAAPAAHVAGALARWFGVLARPSLPEGAWDKSPLRVRFYNAGLRNASAPLVYFGAKTLLTFALPGALLLMLWAGAVQPPMPVMMLLLLLLAGVGYYLPNAGLAHLIARRQRELFEAFPDALDLMRVCIEAGLGLDGAIERVGHEMALESPALSDEFHLVSLELRAGASRADALRNLALRVSLDDIDAMVAMLVQSDRFGTSISDALRVHSEALRIKRRLLAEEQAAKLPVKLMFPLVFCVFPALLTVLLGPAFVSIYRYLFPAVGAGS